MEQKKSRAAEVIRFALTGGVCFLVELAVLILLKGKFGVDTLIATPIAFLVSVILNYLLCVVWVFRGTKNRGTGAKAGFLITSLIGLGLNELIMYCACELVGLHYMISKLLSTALVFFWNFFARKLTLFYKQTNQ